MGDSSLQIQFKNYVYVKQDRLEAHCEPSLYIFIIIIIKNIQL